MGKQNAKTKKRDDPVYLEVNGKIVADPFGTLIMPRHRLRRQDNQADLDSWHVAGNPLMSAWATNIELSHIPKAEAGWQVDAVVIGAGQAGLAVAHELQKQGFVGFVGKTTASSSVPEKKTFVILDAENEPGGAWKHQAWALKVQDIYEVRSLPGYKLKRSSKRARRAGLLSSDEQDASFLTERARDVFPQYFMEYEDKFDLPVIRPVRVLRVDGNEAGELLVQTNAGAWQTNMVFNCTGYWTRPFVPALPGIIDFRGNILHTKTYRSASGARGKVVAVLGDNPVALKHINEIASFAKKVFWCIDDFENIRHSTLFRDSSLADEKIAEVLAKDNVQRVSWPTALGTHSMVCAGTKIAVDSLLFATGFRPELRHLAPLKLRDSNGTLALDNRAVLRNAQVFMVGGNSEANFVSTRQEAKAAVQQAIGLTIAMKEDMTDELAS